MCGPRCCLKETGTFPREKAHSSREGNPLKARERVTWQKRDTRGSQQLRGGRVNGKNITTGPIQREGNTAFMSGCGPGGGRAALPRL